MTRPAAKPVPEQIIVDAPTDRIRSACARLADVLIALPDQDRAVAMIEAFADGLDAAVRVPAIARVGERALGGILNDLLAIAHGEPTSADVLREVVDICGPMYQFAEALRRSAP